MTEEQKIKEIETNIGTDINSFRITAAKSESNMQPAKDNSFKLIKIV